MGLLLYYMYILNVFAITKYIYIKQNIMSSINEQIKHFIVTISIILQFRNNTTVFNI